MRQAKMKMPRTISTSKQFANTWRPQCALFGAWMFQELECFWVADPDTIKEANLEITLLARLLHHCADHTPGTSLPGTSLCRWHANGQTIVTTLQGKANISSSQSSMLGKSGNTSECVEMTNSKAGHGHNQQDQRLAEATTAIMNARVLQQPIDFVNVLQQRIVRRNNRKLFAERLPASLDWKSFFGLLPTNMTGHTQTANMKAVQVETCHVWRFVRRQNFDYRQDISTAWPEFPPMGAMSFCWSNAKLTQIAKAKSMLSSPRILIYHNLALAWQSCDAWQIFASTSPWVYQHS